MPLPASDEYEPTGDYLPLVGEAGTSRDAFYSFWLDSIDNGSYSDCWTDGTYVYTARGTEGLSAYYLNSTDKLVWLDTIDNSGNYQGVWGDGNYIYVGTDTDLYAYSFNGACFTFINSSTVNAWDVWGDGTFIYVSEKAVDDKCHALSFNGANFTLYDSINLAVSIALDIAGEIKGGQTYLYIQSYNNGLDAVVFNRTTDYTFDDSVVVSYGSGFGRGVFCYNGYLFYVCSESHIKVLTFNGTGFTLVGQDTEALIGSGYNGVWACDSFGSDIYVFSEMESIGIYSFIWDPSTVTLENLDRINGSASGGGLCGYGDFTYPSSGHLYCTYSKLNVLYGYGTRFSANSITVAQGMNTSWYNYNTTVPDIEYAVNNINDGGVIYVWNGIYPNWGYTKYQTSGGTDTRINVANVTIIGNSSSTTTINDRFRMNADITSIDGFYITGGVTIAYNATSVNNCFISKKLEISGNNNTIENCTIYDAAFYCIDLTGATSRDNNITGCYLTEGGNYCIWIRNDANNNMMYDNYINNADGGGIHIDGASCSNNTIMKNYIRAVGKNGIYIEESDYGLIQDNYCYDCDDGIEIEDGANFWQIISNTIFNCSDNGIEFDGADDGLILDNRIYENGDDGIHFDSSLYHMRFNVTGNIIVNNTDRGMYCPAFIYSLVYNNYFSGNGDNIYASAVTGTYWNVTKRLGINIIGGPYIMGNYYNDYTGVDSDGDGIGDTPYDIAT